MPGNIVVINNSKELTWYIGDSKMPLLITFLNINGERLSPKQRKSPKSSQRRRKQWMLSLNKKDSMRRSHENI